MDFYEGLQVVYKGKQERLKRSFIDSQSFSPINPIDPWVYIFNAQGVLVSSGAPTIETEGNYYFNLTLSTASSTPEGTWAAYWQGTINGEFVTMDTPQYFWVKSITPVLGDGEFIISAIRRKTGDINASQYVVQPQDMYFYLADAVKQIESEYPMGYEATVTPNYISFNKEVLPVPRTLFVIQSAINILESVHHNRVMTGMSLSMGDVKIQMKDTFVAGQAAVRDLIRDKEALLYSVKMNCQENTVGIVNVTLYGSC